MLADRQRRMPFRLKRFASVQANGPIESCTGDNPELHIGSKQKQLVAKPEIELGAEHLKEICFVWYQEVLL